ncbi:hypothetical protein H9623_07970 [Oerskovia sp. Sa1BUA8]|uniref:L-amino acid ligase C-terminal domain-containing protein n=1 Tax=Oerskovia douganii TaxID=2762210 RepID=A0A9D5YYT9_9CELL|nr:hypothetical protein [Oerskovia douganii]MBE7700237.1 hypothetical protein [Oerskovia douganii]
MTSSRHVVVVGNPGPVLPALAELGAHTRLSWLALVPDLARHGQGPFRTAHALHRDAKPEDWVTMARVLADTQEVSGVWHVGSQLADVAEDVAAELGASLVGGVPHPADGARAETGGPELSAKVLRRDGHRAQLLLTTRVQRHASGAVLTEDGPHEVDRAEVLAWCLDHVPASFLGSVDFVVTPSGLRRTGVRPWQPTDGTTELLRTRGMEAVELAWSVLTGAEVSVAGTDGSGPDGGPASVAVAAYGSEVAGALVALDGLDDARNVPGVLDVRALANLGSDVLPLSEGGEFLVRIAAGGATGSGALSTAIDGLARTAPTLDIVPSLAGSLDRVWF